MSAPRPPVSVSGSANVPSVVRTEESSRCQDGPSGLVRR